MRISLRLCAFAFKKLYARRTQSRLIKEKGGRMSSYRNLQLLILPPSNRCSNRREGSLPLSLNKIGLGFSVSHAFEVVNDEGQDQTADP